jgi:hypothetical protein
MTLDPYHLTMWSDSSRTATFWCNIHRYSPSARRMSASNPNGLPLTRHSSPPRDERGHVVSVHRRRPIPALKLLQSESKKLEPALVEEVQVSVRTTRMDQRG